MNASEVHAYLNSFNNFESQLHKLRSEDFNLHRIHKFLDQAGNPSTHLKIIHVAGTKGKGSTCAFLASILQQAGLKVGLYTSPHLHKVNERIRILSPENINSQDPYAGSISDDEIGLIVNFLRPILARIQNDGVLITYFEVLTVVALCYFAKSQVDVVILETGLGGRLDATNAVNSSIAVITSISRDHTRILGDTIGKIAFEKACIIKSTHQNVVIAPQENEAMEVILDRCKEFGVQPIVVNNDKYDGIKIGLKGRHQIINAATAIEVVNILKTKGFNISDGAIKDGLEQVRWPGRFELIRKNPDVIVDCAHNDASAKTLSETLMQEYPKRRVILVLGISQDKDIASICKYLNNNATHIILTRAQHPRSHQFIPEEGKKYFGNKPVEIIDDLPKALEKALKIANPLDVILVTGSVFVVAEAKSYLSIKQC